MPVGAMSGLAPTGRQEAYCSAQEGVCDLRHAVRVMAVKRPRTRLAGAGQALDGGPSG